MTNFLFFIIFFINLHQLVEIVLDLGPDSIPVPEEVKRDLLLNLNEVSSTVELPEDWEGAAPELLMEQLASAWEIDLQQFFDK